VRNSELLKWMICPEDKASALHEADADLLARLNTAIHAGAIRNNGGEIIRDPLEGGLVREDGAVLYPVRDELPVMVIEEGIALNQLD